MTVEKASQRDQNICWEPVPDTKSGLLILLMLFVEFGEVKVKVLTHQTDIKELVVTKADCCTATRRLCLGCCICTQQETIADGQRLYSAPAQEIKQLLLTIFTPLLLTTLTVS